MPENSAPHRPAHFQKSLLGQKMLEIGVWEERPSENKLICDRISRVDIWTALLPSSRVVYVCPGIDCGGLWLI